MANLFAPGSEIFSRPPEGLVVIPVGVSLSGAWCGGDAGRRRGLGPLSEKMQFGVDAPVISGLSERIVIWDGALVIHGRHDMALPREDLVTLAPRTPGGPGNLLLRKPLPVPGNQPVSPMGCHWNPPDVILDQARGARLGGISGISYPGMQEGFHPSRNLCVVQVK